MTEDRDQAALTLLKMMSELNFDQIAFLVGYMTIKDIDLAARAMTALQFTDVGQVK